MAVAHRCDDHTLPNVSMGFADMKVIEGKRFLESIRDGATQAPSTVDALASARVIDAMVRSIEQESWTDVREISVPASAVA
jgi:predicted dehydrogenase